MSSKSPDALQPIGMQRTAGAAYTNCHTRIVDLRPLNLPLEANTPDLIFRQLYQDYISVNKSLESSNHNHARQLASAITSVTTGIAPPVAFPTETVYGLGADATNPSSIAGIFAAKGRPSDNPLILHVSSVEHLERCLGGTSEKSAVPIIYHDLIQEFWPGPLTILIPVPSDDKGIKFAPNVHPGQSTIGFRLPSSPYARFLIAVTDRPIAAPSANSSGKPSPTTARHVLDDLDGKINFILDGGSCDVGVESTVVDGLGPIPLILRPGGLSKVELKRWGKEKGNVWAHVKNGWEVEKKQGIKRKRSGEISNGVEEIRGDKDLHQHQQQEHVNGTTTMSSSTELNHVVHEESSPAPRAPGMKYKHYAPNARMFLIELATSNITSQGDEQISNVTPALTNLVVDILHQTQSLPTTAPPPQNQNGHSEQITPSLAPPSPSARPLVLSVLTSTSWPAFANLESCLPGWVVTQIPDDTCAHIRLTTPASTTNQLPVLRQIDLYSLDLGHESATISNRLFAALRTCDDLRSDFILAEAPARVASQNGSIIEKDIKTEVEGDSDDEFETVLERMRKAASDIIQL